MAESPLIVLEGVCHGFREGGALRPVLRGVSAEVARGEFIALLGQSGSGKSTLLNLLAGLDQPAAGRIWIAGEETTALREPARTRFRCRWIGFVHQFFHLIPTLSVLENVMLPAELNGQDRRRAQSLAERLLAEVGVADRAGSFPDVLSGGEQQRVAIARALIHQPILLLGDEPTGNLDSVTGRQILDLLQRVVVERGTTLLLATHSEAVAERADRIWRLRDGSLER